MVGICLVLITTRDEITEFLWEPLPDQGQLFAKLIEAKFFSKVDLSKGNYQLPVKKKKCDPILHSVHTKDIPIVTFSLSF